MKEKSFRPGDMVVITHEAWLQYGTIAVFSLAAPEDHSWYGPRVERGEPVMVLSSRAEAPGFMLVLAVGVDGRCPRVAMTEPGWWKKA